MKFYCFSSRQPCLQLTLAENLYENIEFNNAKTSTQILNLILILQITLIKINLGLLMKNKTFNMQKIKKGLEEKLNLISKIQNNLRVKKYDFSNNPSRTKVDTLLTQKNNDLPSSDVLRQFKLNTTKNPESQIVTWINIKRMGNIENEFQPNFQTRQSYKSFDDKIFISTYSNKFAARNGLMKIVQLKSLVKDKSNKNISSQFLRKTFLEKNSRTFSPDKFHKNKFNKNYPQKDTSFYGKINETNHVSGTRFKTLVSKNNTGSTKNELKQQSRKRENSQHNFSTINQPPVMRKLQPRSIYELSLNYNGSHRQGKSLQLRYNSNIMLYENGLFKDKRQRGRNQAKSKDRYSPWNQNQGVVAWDELPKIK